LGTKFEGCGTALVTPFRADGSLDEATLRALVRRQIGEGIDFLVPCGTTGESPTLTHREHLRVVEIAVEEAGAGKRKVPVVGGAGGYNTAEVVALAREIEAIGADGLLSVSPYYNKPTQEGQYQHFKAIAEATKLPIVLYNIKGRTGVNIETSTLKRLAGIPNIVGVKEASGDISQMASVIHEMPASFAVLSGDDALTIPLIALGGRGLISVISNELPGEMARLTRLAMDGDFAGARAVQRKLYPLMEVNFVESNPVPVKYVMHRMGLLELSYRLPITPPLAASRARIDAVLESMGLLTGLTVHAGR
jgi:4-hydroxy-tetrahydrodipicolinate synthase